MISEILSKALEDIEAYQETLPHTDESQAEEIDSVKAVMRTLLKMLEHSPIDDLSEQDVIEDDVANDDELDNETAKSSRDLYDTYVSEGDVDHWPTSEAERQELAQLILGSYVVFAYDFYVGLAQRIVTANEPPPIPPVPVNWSKRQQAQWAVFQKLSPEDRTTAMELVRETVEGALFETLVQIDNAIVGEFEITLVGITPDGGSLPIRVAPGTEPIHDQFYPWIKRFSRYDSELCAPVDTTQGEANSSSTSRCGWTLRNVEEQYARSPKMFNLPDAEVRKRLVPGLLVKLIFEPVAPVEMKSEMYGGERMWVEVSEHQDAGYVGVLSNEPRLISGLSVGDRIEFRPEHVFDVRFPDDTSGLCIPMDSMELLREAEEKSKSDRVFEKHIVMDDGLDGMALVAPDEPTPALDYLATLGMLVSGSYPDGQRYYEIVPQAQWPNDGREAEREEMRAALGQSFGGKQCSSEDHADEDIES